MEKQQEMVKVLCVDENDNHYIEEVPVEEINKAMEYANKLDELSAEERQDILSLIDKLHLKISNATIIKATKESYYGKSDR